MEQKYDNPLLKELEIQENTWADARSFIEPEIARLINSFILSTNAKSVLELGTCIGYSGIWFAEALKKNEGLLTTIEYDLTLVKEAKTNFKKAGVEKYIKLMEGDIKKLLKNIPAESFDIIVQDARKSLYPEMLEDCIRIVKKGGIIFADDVLYCRIGTAHKITKHLEEYNRLICSDPRLYSLILPLGQGLSISIKE